MLSIRRPTARRIQARAPAYTPRGEKAAPRHAPCALDRGFVIVLTARWDNGTSRSLCRGTRGRRRLVLLARERPRTDTQRPGCVDQRRQGLSRRRNQHRKARGPGQGDRLPLSRAPQSRAARTVRRARRRHRADPVNWILAPPRDRAPTAIGPRRRDRRTMRRPLRSAHSAGSSGFALEQASAARGPGSHRSSMRPSGSLAARSRAIRRR